MKEHAKDNSALGKDLNLKRKLKLDPMKRREFITNVTNDVNVSIVLMLCNEVVFEFARNYGLQFTTWFPLQYE